MRALFYPGHPELTLNRQVNGIRWRGRGRRGRDCFEVSWRGVLANGEWGQCRLTVHDYEEAIKLRDRKVREAQNYRDGIAGMIAPNVERARVGPFLLDALEAEWRFHEVKGLRQALSKLKIVRAEFGQRLVLALAKQPELLQQVYDGWQKKGSSIATCNRRMEIIGRAYRLAVEKGKLTLAQVPAVPHKTENNARQGFLPTGTFNAIVEKVEDATTADFLRFFFWTGMRPSEIASLSWTGFDREEWIVRLPGKDAKIGEPRFITLDGELRKVIERRLAERRFGCDLIFHRQGEGMKGNFVLKRWLRARIDAGVDQPFVPYDLRRTAIRNMVRAGVSRKVAMSISGHRTELTFNRYDITNEEDVRQALTRTERDVEERRLAAEKEAAGKVAGFPGARGEHAK